MFLSVIQGQDQSQWPQMKVQEIPQKPENFLSLRESLSIKTGCNLHGQPALTVSEQVGQYLPASSMLWLHENGLISGYCQGDRKGKRKERKERKGIKKKRR